MVLPLSSLIHFMSFALAANALADIAIYPITDVNKTEKTGYFSDPFHVPYESGQKVYFAGTTQNYLECDGSLKPKCASLPLLANKFNCSKTLLDQKPDKTYVCSVAGIHPFQSEDKSWDAVATLHLQDTPDCDGITGWSVIVHAHPKNSSHVDTPPTHWVGDQLFIGSFSVPEDANYDGKYFRTPSGQLYLLFSKRQGHEDKKRQDRVEKKRDGVAAWPMDNPQTKTPGSKPTFLLVPDDDLNSEDYHKGNHDFKLIETGNVRAINGKFVMAYSVGAFNNNSYKAAVAYSDTFLPPQNQYYRKVMKDNPDHLWGTSRPKEAYYLLQAEHRHPGWRYVGDQVLAPGVPTVASIGPDHGWVLTFAGYNPDDAPQKDDTNKYKGHHRRPYFIKINVNIPKNTSVREASDAELQNWITPVHIGDGDASSATGDREL